MADVCDVTTALLHGMNLSLLFTWTAPFMQLRVLSVDPDALKALVPVVAEVAQIGDAPRDLVVVGDDGAALDGVEELRRVEAQRGDVAVGAEGTSLIRRAEGMRLRSHPHTTRV